MHISTSCTVYPIVAALVEAEDELNLQSLKAANPMQKQFLQEFVFACRGDVQRIPEIQSIVSASAAEINTFLKKRGFDIRLKPLNPQTRGFAAVLDLAIKWSTSGTVTKIVVGGGRQFDGVRLPATLSEVDGHQYPIAEIATMNGEDAVRMTVLDEAVNGFELINSAETLSKRKPNRISVGCVTFPMVKLDDQVDVSWMKDFQGMTHTGQPWRICEALQQTRFSMDEQGVFVQSAMAYSGLLEAPQVGLEPKPIGGLQS